MEITSEVLPSIVPACSPPLAAGTPDGLSVLDEQPAVAAASIDTLNASANNFLFMFSSLYIVVDVSPLTKELLNFNDIIFILVNLFNALFFGICFNFLVL